MERLDVFNGFLHSAHLDTLFDSGIVTFDGDGTQLPSPRLNPSHRILLEIADNPPQRLRWISPDHLPYLAWHRTKVFRG